MEKAKLVLAAIIALVCVTACPLIISRADKGTERRQRMSAGAEDYDVLLVIRRRDQDTGEWADWMLWIDVCKSILGEESK